MPNKRLAMQTAAAQRIFVDSFLYQRESSMPAGMARKCARDSVPGVTPFVAANCARITQLCDSSKKVS